MVLLVVVVVVVVAKDLPVVDVDQDRTRLSIVMSNVVACTRVF